MISILYFHEENDTYILNQFNSPNTPSVAPLLSQGQEKAIKLEDG